MIGICDICRYGQTDKCTNPNRDNLRECFVSYTGTTTEEKRIRAETIDEFLKAIEKHQTRQDSYLEPPYIEMGLDMTDVLEVARELKEKKE